MIQTQSLLFIRAVVFFNAFINPFQPPMVSCFEEAAQNGFIISMINCKMRSILTKSDYSVLQHSETLEDVIIKLLSTPYQKYISEEAIFSKKVFKSQLSKSLVFEILEIRKLSDPDVGGLLNLYVDLYKIQNFVFLLAAKEHDPDLSKTYSRIEEVGKFNELETLKFAADMNEVYKFCVEHTFLKKYYKRIVVENEIKSNNFQIIQSQLMKFLIEDFYDVYKESSGFIKNILQCQGDRWILEIVLNTLECSEYVGKKRMRLFPKVFSFNLGLVAKLSNCTNVDELKGLLVSHPVFGDIVTADEDDMINALVKIEMEMYWESFTRANDIACVYAYLKIKEHEIKSIIMTVECISMKKKDFVKNLITHMEEH